MSSHRSSQTGVHVVHVHTESRTITGRARARARQTLSTAQSEQFCVPPTTTTSSSSVANTDNKTVVPELLNERSKAGFNVRRMTYVWNGSEEKTLLMERMRDLIENDAVFNNDKDIFFSREQKYTEALRRSARAIDIASKLSLSLDEFERLLVSMNINSPVFLHQFLFLHTLESQADDEQRKRWLPIAKAYGIIGNYAQTELAHGSNVRGLGTTATFVAETDEFEINTPDLLAVKWWPGALGHTSTHAIIFARLILGGKDLGIHSFLVQLRSLQDHSPLAGIEVGDIGDKMGFASIDNGFLRLDKVRIPRTNMLMRFARVTCAGEYKTSPASKKLTFGTMTRVRTHFVESSSFALSKAVTIAIRYSAVRRQFKADRGDQKEVQIMDYGTQQHQLFPLLASAFAIRFTALQMNNLLDATMVDPTGGGLGELHASSCGLKSLCTRIASDGIETCRRCCGGHGYMAASGLPELYTYFVHMCTAEGENYVVTQQTTRYLLKNLAKSQTHGDKVSGSASYINEIHSIRKSTCALPPDESLCDLDVLVAAFRHRVAWRLYGLALSLNAARSNGASEHEIWNRYQMDAHRVSDAHSLFVIASAFVQGVKQQTDAAIKDILTALARVFILGQLENVAADFVLSGYFDGAQLMYLKDALLDQFVVIRSNAVALVDAFGHSDFVLNSALGRHDGQVYDALYKSAKSNPMNQSDVHAAYDKVLKPLMNGAPSRMPWVMSRL
jgi:acyl-CoA oxidase